MKIYIADDNLPFLRELSEQLRFICLDAQIYTFARAEDLLFQAKCVPCELACLSLDTRRKAGLRAAASLRKEFPCTKVMLLSASDTDYRGQSDVTLQRPAAQAQVRQALIAAGVPLKSDAAPRLRVQCFGNFDVFVNGQPLHFARARAKEVFAYLIHKRGTACTTREIAAVLFEDAAYNTTQQKYVQTIFSSLKSTLNHAGAQNVLVKRFNSLAVDPAFLDCDYYRYLEKDPNSANAYIGEYMSQYSWAESVASYLGHCV